MYLFLYVYLYWYIFELVDVFLVDALLFCFVEIVICWWCGRNLFRGGSLFIVVFFLFCFKGIFLNKVKIYGISIGL